MRLGEVCSIERAAVPTGDKVWLLNLDAVEKDSGRVLEKRHVDRSEVGPSTVPFSDKAVLYSKLRPNLNKVVLPDSPGIATSEMLPLLPDERRLNRVYLSYFLRSKAFVAHAVNSTAGSKMPRASKAAVMGCVIPLPPLSIQNSISAAFKSIEDALGLLDSAKRGLDLLVKSRFNEMFGIYSNTTVKLGDYCEKITKGTTPTTAGFQFQDEGINFIKVETIDKSGRFLSNKFAYISKECHEAFSRSQLCVGDILFSIAGAIGRSAIVQGDILPANTNQALAIIRLSDSAPFKKCYLREALASDVMRLSAEKAKRGIAQENISLTDIRRLKIPIPPLSLQQQFADFVSRVDKLRFVTTPMCTVGLARMGLGSAGSQSDTNRMGAV